MQGQYDKAQSWFLKPEYIWPPGQALDQDSRLGSTSSLPLSRLWIFSDYLPSLYGSDPE